MICLNQVRRTFPQRTVQTCPDVGTVRSTQTSTSMRSCETILRISWDNTTNTRRIKDPSWTGAQMFSVQVFHSDGILPDNPNWVQSLGSPNKIHVTRRNGSAFTHMVVKTPQYRCATHLTVNQTTVHKSHPVVWCSQRERCQQIYHGNTVSDQLNLHHTEETTQHEKKVRPQKHCAWSFSTIFQTTKKSKFGPQKAVWKVLGIFVDLPVESPLPNQILDPRTPRLRVTKNPPNQTESRSMR